MDVDDKKYPFDDVQNGFIKELLDKNENYKYLKTNNLGVQLQQKL